MSDTGFSRQSGVSVARATAQDRARRGERARRLMARGAGAQPRTPTPVSPTLAAFGEVGTALLPTATALRRSEVEELLEFHPGRRAHWRERPVSLGISATTAEGVDCVLAAPGHPAVRAIGTVALRALVIGGRVAQSSAQSFVTRAASDKRMPWSHYLTKDGVLEVITKVTEETGGRLSEGFLAAQSSAQTLDLTSITDRLLVRIRMDERLGGEPPLKVGSTRLRWVARVGAVPASQIAFRVHDDTRRTVLLLVPSEQDLAVAQRFCEDLAVHDWLLSAVASVIERADLAGPGSPASAEILAPFLQHLAHLWVPGVHSPRQLRAPWRQLQDDPDFTADWRRSIDHLRNRLLVATWNSARSGSAVRDQER
ncbi:SCO2521 family protein [Nocardia arizonensis]|uniref:SCO2521 family protein n=1 Tax=Nocardia arizonensis TaxID=1141647 RepID=UPI0006CF8AB4|nr:SCO2521 family protein [Nocardia arizonensis]